MQDTSHGIVSRQLSHRLVLSLIACAVLVLIFSNIRVYRPSSAPHLQLHGHIPAFLNTATRPAAEQQQLILIDTDKNTLPMMLNALIALADSIGPVRVAKMTRILCFDDESCEFVDKAGFEVVAGGTAAAVLEGFNNGSMNRTANWLDDYCLAREQALLYLISQGATVMRTDSDVCFTTNPFEVLAQLDADILVTAQPLPVEYEGGMWSYNWQCNASLAPLPVTLNNGVLVINGRKPAIKKLYGQAYGLGVKLLALSKNGWAQCGFNALLHFKGLCLHQMSKSDKYRPSSTATNSTSTDALMIQTATLTSTNPKGCPHTADAQLGYLRGKLPDGTRLATLKVLSPCQPCNFQSNNLAHANCLGKSVDAKMQWLHSIGCWRLPPNWDDPKQLTRDASRFMQHLLAPVRNSTSLLQQHVSVDPDRLIAANATQLP